MPTCTVLPAGYDLDALSASGFYSVGLRAILAKTKGATAEEVGFSWMNSGMTYMLGMPASA